MNTVTMLKTLPIHFETETENGITTNPVATLLEEGKSYDVSDHMLGNLIALGVVELAEKSAPENTEEAPAPKGNKNKKSAPENK